MKLYAQIIDNNLKTCIVGEGTTKEDVEYYESIGMSKMDVEKAYNGNWYVKGYEPQPPAPTKEEISELRKAYRRENIDDKTAERSRKMANGTWTETDEQDYLALDAEVTAYIEEHFPYQEE